MKVESYEQEVLNILCADVLPNSILHEAIISPEEIQYKHFGAGYNLYIKHKELPKESMVIEQPNIIGNCQGLSLGFVVFLGNNEICLECYNNETNDGVPEGIRNGNFTITAT